MFKKFHKDKIELLKSETSQILSLLTEIGKESETLPKNLYFESALRNHIFNHESILKKFSEDLTVYNIKTNADNVYEFLFRLNKTADDLLTREIDGLEKSFSYYDSILSNKLYKRYFYKIKKLFFEYKTFINNVYISGWQKIKNIKNNGKIIDNLLVLLFSLRKELKSLKKTVERIIYAAELINKKYDYCKKELVQMESEIEKIKGTLQKYYYKYQMHGGETIDGNITFFKVTNNLLKKKADRLNKLKEKYSVAFSEENDLSKKITELLQYSENKFDLPRRELALEFLLKFKKAFENNDQHGMYNILVFYEKKGLPFTNTNIIGTNSGLTAYHGVVKWRRKDGKWADGGGGYNLQPEYYARRLKGILKEGIQPGTRVMSGGIEVPNGPGIYFIGNIYFYIKPHMTYGGNMISWNLNDYCVFQGPQHEYFIVTPRNIPPNKLTLICGENQGPLYQELKKLNVPFKIFYKSHAELHAPL